MYASVAVLIATLLLSACAGGAGLTPNTGSQMRATGSLAPGVAMSGYKQLYAFKGTPDGASPYGGFVAVGKTLYATTLNGSKNYCSSSCGSNDCYLGCGTVFT